MAKPCAFRDCGDPTCHLCALARIPTRKVEKRLADGLRENAKASPRAAKASTRRSPKRVA